METKQFFDCEKQSGQIQEVFTRTNDFSHILNIESKKNTATLIIGKRECGKTHLIKDIINTYNKNNIINDLYIFTWNKSSYDDIVENINCIIDLNDNNGDDFEKYFEKIKLNQDKINKKKKSIVVIDDNIEVGKLLKKIKQLILNIHNLQIELILSVQYPLGLSPEIRSQFDNVIIFQDEVISNLKRTYEFYFGMIPTFKSYQQIIKNLGNYECIISTQNNKILQDMDKIFIYKSNCNNYQSKIKLTSLDLNNHNENNNDNVNSKIELKNKIIQTIQKNNLKIKKITDENNELIKSLNIV